MTPLHGHDAFRARSRTQHPTLHSAYPLLCLMTDTPQTNQALAQALGCDKRSIQRAVGLLRQAGLVITSPLGHRLTSEPIDPLLDTAATVSGTRGTRRAQINTYRAEAEANRRFLADTTVVGTEAWRKYARRDVHQSLMTDSWAPLLTLIQERGDTVESFAEEVIATREATLLAQPVIWEGFLAQWSG
jgi:biotin operon repressor